MSAYRRVYDSRHQQADCQEPGSDPEPYARPSSMGYLFRVRCGPRGGKMFGILSQLNAVQSSSERDSDATAWSASGAVQCAAVLSVPDYDSSISAAVRFAPAAAADENRLLSIRFARRTRGARFFYMIRFVACVMDGVDDAQ